MAAWFNEVVQRNVTTVSGGQGKYLDRYIAKERNGLPLLPENDTGRYLADDGATYTSRALAPGTLDSSQLIRYEVMDDIRFEAGPIAPWFDEVGGATQYFVIGPQGRVRTVKDLINDGALRVIYPKPTAAQLTSGKTYLKDIDELPDGYKFSNNGGVIETIVPIDIGNPKTPPLKIESDGKIIKWNTSNATKNDAIPITQDKFNEIINLEQKNRPENVSDYLPSTYIAKHLAKFGKEGGAFIFIDKGDLNPAYPAFPQRKFVGLASEMDAVIAKYKSSGGDWNVLNDELDLGAKDLSLAKITYIKIDPGDPRFSYEIPNGNELGAYPNEWVPGGFTKSGTAEAVLIGSEKIVHNNSLDELEALFKTYERLQ